QHDRGEEGPADHRSARVAFYEPGPVVIARRLPRHVAALGLRRRARVPAHWRPGCGWRAGGGAARSRGGIGPGAGYRLVLCTAHRTAPSCVYLFVTFSNGDSTHRYIRGTSRTAADFRREPPRLVPGSG